MSECERCETLSVEIVELRAVIPDPAKLWSLAEWLEMRYPGDPNPEIQDDLRAWAKAIYATDPAKYSAYWVQAICDEEARAALSGQPSTTNTTGGTDHG